MCLLLLQRFSVGNCGVTTGFDPGGTRLACSQNQAEITEICT